MRLVSHLLLLAVLLASALPAWAQASDTFPTGALKEMQIVRNISGGRVTGTKNRFEITKVLSSQLTETPSGCAGDCDGKGTVTVDEILTMVNIALGNSDVSACEAGDANGDAQITVDEILAAVNNALSGCGGTGTPTPTPAPGCHADDECPASYPHCGPDGNCWTQPCSDVCSDGQGCCGGSYPYCGPDNVSCWSQPCATLCGTTCCGPSQQCQANGTCSSPQGTPTPTQTPQPSVTASPHLYCRTPSGGLPIPDGDPLGGVGDTLTIAEALSISDLKVRLEITHSWVGDLVVTLHHVDDLSSATLIDRPGVPGIDELGCGHSDILCTLDDTAGEAVEDQCADTGPAIAGTLRPNEPLSTFKGESSAGTWSLSVYDESPGDTGSLVSWCLEVNATAPPFTYGPPRTVSVNTGAATEVADPTTGVTFVFPQGGHGMLTTATIISSPYQPTSGGSGFHFEFTGTEPIQFKLPQTAGAETQVYAWGTSHGCFDGPPRTQRWNTWPESSLQDADLLFDTPDDSDQSSQAAQASATAAGTPIQYHDYWVNKITPSSTSGERKQLLTDQVREDINGWLQKLSDPLLSVARAQFNNFGPRIYDDATGGGYIGFARRRVLGISFSPRITFELANAPTRVVAHETGHLMNHLLLRAHLGDTAGDAMYLRIENLLEDNHGLGDAFVPRKTTTEEIAYLSQYLVTGSIDNIDPYNFTTVVPQYFRGTPSTVDFPSLEGFGAILLSNLMRPSATMNDWERKSAAVPAIGALWNDVAGIVAVGATNINEYRTNIQAFLDGRGQGDRLGINAERLGWSYHGKGTVYATGTRDPVAGVIVTSLVKIDGTEYTASQATTDASGQFTLPRLIPGCSMLRVAKDQHTVDYSTCNGWDRPTTDEITLSDSFITVEPPPGNPTVTVDPPSGSTFELGTGAWFTITVTPVPGTTITRIEAWRVGTEYSDYFLGQSFDSNTLTTGDNDPHPDSLNTGHYRAWVHDSRGGPSFKFDFSYTWVFQ